MRLPVRSVEEQEKMDWVWWWGGRVLSGKDGGREGWREGRMEGGKQRGSEGRTDGRRDGRKKGRKEERYPYGIDISHAAYYTVEFYSCPGGKYVPTYGW